MIQSTLFSDLDDKPDGHIIYQIEGVLIKLFEAKEFEIKKGPNKGNKFRSQDASMVDSDGTLHRLKFVEDAIQPQEMWKKKLRISSHKGKHGFTGLILKVEKSGDEEYRKIQVSSSAIIELVDASGAVSTPTGSDSTHRNPQEGDDSGHPSTTRPAATGGARKGSLVEGSQATFEHRLKEWFKAYRAVCNEALLDPDDVVSRLSPTDVKEITTGLCMSFKGQYGVYADIIWEAGSPAQSTEVLTGELDPDKEFDLPPAKPAATAKPKKAEPTWKDFIHPTRKVSLGELAEDTEAWPVLCFWALSKTDKNGDSTLKNPKPEVAEAQANILLGIEDHGPSYRDIMVSAVMEHKDYGTKFDDKDFLKYLENAYNVTEIKKLNDKGTKEVIREFSDVIEEMTILHKSASKEEDSGDLPP